MGVKKRGLLQIIADILQSLKSNPLRKTHITFKCNLDSRTISKYLEIMESNGLLHKHEDNTAYFQITPKGFSYLQRYRSFINLLDDEESKQYLETNSLLVTNS